jgi:beta-phosphoglucomutase
LLGFYAFAGTGSPLSRIIPGNVTATDPTRAFYPLIRAKLARAQPDSSLFATLTLILGARTFMAIPNAIIFDLDGVITDTAAMHYLAWKQLADDEGIPFTHADNDHLRGIDRRQSLLYVLKGRQVTEAKFEELLTRKNVYYLEHINKITPKDLLPGVIEFIDEARAREIKVGLASSSKNALLVITNLGLIDRLDAIGDGYTVSNPKPAPDLFVWVAGRLGFPPRSVVVVEDAEAGVEAALKAGMYTVGLGPTSRVGKAHLVFPHLDGVRLDDVLNRLPPEV